MDYRYWNKILLGLTVMAPIPYVAYAEVYLTEQQAVDVFFPGVAMKEGWFDLNPSEASSIEKRSHERVLTKRIRMWTGPEGETVIIDEVVGKHEFITYAVGLNADGTVKGIEIMDYRETYGYQVRDESWRKRFVGKSIKDPLKVDKDIPNISGATLSSVHVTNGVRRVLFTYETLKAKT